jgi:taurine dioxygenase
MSILLRPLPGVGAEVEGVDLSSEPGPGEAELLRSAFAAYGLLFFRSQSLDEPAHIAFAKRWGAININRFFAAHPEHPEIALVLKEADQKDNIGGGWHTDHSYDAQPALGSILAARELPPHGGSTVFASMYRAYDALSPEMKKRLEGLKAVHSARHVFGSKAAAYRPSDVRQGRIGNAAAADVLADVVHPVVIRHPLSGKLAIYVNPAFTTRIVGFEESESDALLKTLYAHCLQPQFQCEFHWKPGSVAFWDNRATWHLARNDYHGHRRLMHRITIEGCALN